MVSPVKAIGYLPLSWGMLLAGLGHYENKSDITFTASFDCCGEDESLNSTDRFDGLRATLGHSGASGLPDFFGPLIIGERLRC